MRVQHHRILAIAAVLAAGAISAAPASARPPDHFRTTGFDVVVYQPCGLVEEVDWTLHASTYYDQAGNETGTTLRFAFDGVITNPVTGETWHDRSRNTVFLEPGGGGAISGVGFNLRLPGEGLVFLAVGRLVFDASGATVFSSAKFPGLDELDAAICEALA
jgi:hypothetical protein